jgi:hypothetical protein
VHELDCRRGAIGRRFIVLPARRGDSQAKPGTNARTTGKHRMSHGRGKQWWPAGMNTFHRRHPIQRTSQGPLDPCYGIHRDPP